MTSSNRLSYITGLDGIRAVAVMAVLFYHANHPWALGGFLGVETFFVLSGFLITSLLLAEWHSTGRINLKNFWLRRARRLLPAVWLLLFILPVLAILFARDTLPRLKEDIPAALFYITNWVYIVREVPYFESFGRPPLLQQLWSLAVEEQFYLLWPLILLVLLRTLKNNRHRLLSATFVMIALASVWMAVLYSPAADPLRVYYGTDTRAAGFLVGAMLAMIWSPWHASQSRASGRGIFETLGWGGLIALVILYNRLNEFQPFLYRGGILVTALASACLIVGASSPTTWISKILETPVLRWIGSRSYSIYLWHWPVFMLTRPGIDIQLPVLLIRVGQVAVTFILAELSYRWIEVPVRHQGFRASIRSFQGTLRQWSMPQKLSAGAGVISASLLLIWQGTIHQVTASPPPEATPIAQITLSVSVINTTPTPDQQALHPSTEVVPTHTGTPAIDLPRVTLIGDSIMQGAAPMIEDVLGEDIYLDAERKRKMEDVPALIETLYNDGHLSQVVVIHLGSNRPFEAPVFDEVMETLLAHQVERVIFVNVHRPIGWEYYINQKFVEGIARWPQAELIDWDALAHSQQGWFIKDQTHLSYRGSGAYVDVIRQRLEAQPQTITRDRKDFPP
ncbi:MAG TPA: acyltransferase family protein [Anaerolineales bacterium]|nr:acyltransferase family protein [Anaerolineales bacterium]